MTTPARSRTSPPRTPDSHAFPTRPYELVKAGRITEDRHSPVLRGIAILSRTGVWVLARAARSSPRLGGTLGSLYRVLK